MHDVILDIQVPVNEVVEIKDDKTYCNAQKFPGYVIVKMVMTDETWYVVRNTRGVTGFVGSAPSLFRLRNRNEKWILNSVKLSLITKSATTLNQHGPLRILSVWLMKLTLKRKIKVIVSMFERETPIELEFDQVEVIK